MPHADDTRLVATLMYTWQRELCPGRPDLGVSTLSRLNLESLARFYPMIDERNFNVPPNVCGWTAGVGPHEVLEVPHTMSLVFLVRCHDGSLGMKARPLNLSTRRRHVPSSKQQKCQQCRNWRVDDSGNDPSLVPN